MKFDEQAFIDAIKSMTENQLKHLESVIAKERQRKMRGWDERGVWGDYICTACPQPFPYLYNQIPVHEGLMCESCVTHQLNTAVPMLNWSPRPITHFFS